MGSAISKPHTPPLATRSLSGRLDRVDPAAAQADCLKIPI